ETTLCGHTGETMSVAFSDDGSMVVSCDSEGNVRVWKAPFVGPGIVLTGHRGPVLCIRLLKDNVLLSAGADRSVRNWDCTSAKELSVLSLSLRCPVTAGAFSNDGSMLALADSPYARAGGVYLWDVTSLRE